VQPGRCARGPDEHLSSVLELLGAGRRE
jgi:hypothetical protein